jgi:nucleoside 2-deoxyribosyltransferase
MSNSANSSMQKRFYLATRKDRSGEAAALCESLRVQGWSRTFEWSAQDGADSDGRAATAVAELEGVRESDVLLVLVPGGYGTHVEIGAALAFGIPVSFTHQTERPWRLLTLACFITTQESSSSSPSVLGSMQS